MKMQTSLKSFFHDLFGLHEWDALSHRTWKTWNDIGYDLREWSECKKCGAITLFKG